MTKKGEQLKKEALGQAPQESITKNSNKKSKKKQGNQAKVLVDLALKNIKLFCDQLNEEFANIKTDKGFPVYKIRSKAFKNWLGYQFYLSENQIASSESLQSALNTLCGHAQFNGKKHDLNVRVANYKDAIWYDLCDVNWRAIKITKKGWKIIEKPPILFRRYSHQLPQTEPSKNGDIDLLKKYINLKNEHEWILMQVWIVFSLIPNLPHPVKILHGSQGSGKTNAEKLIRKLIDPSEIEVIGMPRGENELTQVLAHHWFLPLDNVSYLSDSISDLLCKAITGSGFSKRELYTTDDDVIYKIKRCISLNGINIAARKPDLLERSILFEFKRISKNKRQTENEIWKQFEKDRPVIFGGILNALSNALSIVQDINLKYKPRMADFAQWGEAIAQALGYASNIFMRAYFKNIKSQYVEAIEAHLIGQSILELMQKEGKKLAISPTDLFDKLNNIASQLKINTNDKMWPKAPNALSRRINEIKSNLAEVGIIIKFSRKTKQREWIIKKIISS